MLTHYTDIAKSTFLPEAVLPVQFFAPPVGSRASGERRLYAAVLAQAWDDLLRYAGARDRRSSRLFKETWDWVISEEETVGSFYYVVTVLNLDATSLRRSIYKRIAALPPRKIPEYTPLTRRKGTRRERKAWVARDPYRHGYWVWVRRAQEVFRLQRFALKAEAEAYCQWARKNMDLEIGRQAPTEILPMSENKLLHNRP